MRVEKRPARTSADRDSDAPSVQAAGRTVRIGRGPRTGSSLRECVDTPGASPDLSVTVNIPPARPDSRRTPASTLGPHGNTEMRISRKAETNEGAGALAALLAGTRRIVTARRVPARRGHSALPVGKKTDPSLPTHPPWTGPGPKVPLTWPVPPPGFDPTPAPAPNAPHV